MNSPLDIEITEAPGGEWEVWTPFHDAGLGTIIGAGPTKEAAIRDTISSLALTIHALATDLGTLADEEQTPAL